MQHLSRILTFVLLCLVHGGQVPAQDPTERSAETLAIARGIAGQAPSSRRTAIEGHLEAAKIPYERQPYLINKKGDGTNLQLRFGPDAGAALLLCAHHDARRGSAGANDDAGGCAVLIQVAKALKARKDLVRPVILLFLDGSQKGLVGAEAWAEAHPKQEVDRVLVFDLCGRGDLLLGGSTTAPEANSALALVPDLLGLACDLPTDHKQFARMGVDAAFVMTCPKDDLEALRLRYETRDFQARLPDFIQDTIRGRDSAEQLEPQALELTLETALKAIEICHAGPASPRTLLPDYLARLKDFDAALVAADFKTAQPLAEQLGFNALVAVLAKKREAEERKAVLTMVLRLVAGKELRSALEEFDPEKAESCAKLAALKPKVQFQGGHFTLGPA